MGSFHEFYLLWLYLCLFYYTVYFIYYKYWSGKRWTTIVLMQLNTRPDITRLLSVSWSIYFCRFCICRGNLATQVLSFVVQCKKNKQKSNFPLTLPTLKKQTFFWFKSITMFQTKITIQCFKIASTNSFSWTLNKIKMPLFSHLNWSLKHKCLSKLFIPHLTTSPFPSNQTQRWLLLN